MLAAGATAALAVVAGCSATGPDAVAGSSATIAVNGPYGVGGPFAAVAATPSARPAGQVSTGKAVSAGETVSAGQASAARVDGSVAFSGSHKVPWLTALGYGVSVTAPATVRPGTAAPGDAEAGFYDSFYAGRITAACGYVVPGQRERCPAALRDAQAAAGSLRNAAVGFVVAKGDQAIVTMTGLVCGGRAARAGCLGQRDPAYVFGYALTFEALWARIERDGGNPLTATPLRRVAGHWYVDLFLAAA